MRTKTTILTAVALAAGLLSSNAQVYSANVVGYYNLTLPALKNVLLTDQLPGNGTSTLLNNEFSNFSNQDAASGNVLLIWNGAGLDEYDFFGPTDGGPAWVKAGDSVPTTVSLPLGTSAFMQNTHATAQTITFVGQVVQGNTTNSLIGLGQSFRALPFPVGTNIDSTIGNANSASVTGDSLLKWNPASSLSPVGFYDASFDYFGPADGGPAWVKSGASDPTNVVFNVGEGFLYQRGTAGNVNWVRSFTVQ